MSCNHFKKFPFPSSPVLLHVWQLISICKSEWEDPLWRRQEVALGRRRADDECAGLKQYLLNRNLLCWGSVLLRDSLLFVTTFLLKFSPPYLLWILILMGLGFMRGVQENNYMYMCVSLLVSHIHHWLTSQHKIIFKKHF